MGDWLSTTLASHLDLSTEPLAFLHLFHEFDPIGHILTHHAPEKSFSSENQCMHSSLMALLFMDQL